MDYVFKLILLFCFVSSPAHASWAASLLALPAVAAVSSGTSTLFSVAATNAQLWAGSAPVITGAYSLDAGYVVSGASAVSSLSLGALGPVLASVPITAAATVGAITLCAASIVCGGSLALAGATIAYLSSQNMALVPSGGGMGTIPATTTSLNYSVWTPQGRVTTYGSASAACLDASLISSNFGVNNFKNPYQVVISPTNSQCWGSNLSGSYTGNYGNAYGSSPICSTGYVLNNGACTYVGTPVLTPISSSTATSTLTANPPTSAQTQAITAELAKLSTPTQNFTPQPDPQTATLTAPASRTGPTTTSVTPTGQTQTASTVSNCSQVTTQSISCSQTTTTTTTQTGSAPVVTTTTNSIPLTPPALTDCEKNPKHVGCLELGDVPNLTPDVISVTASPVTFSPTSLGSGTCPAGLVMATSRGTYTLSYAPLCSFASLFAPVFIAMSYLIAGYIVFGSVKDA